MHISFADDADGSVDSDAISAYALLLALMYLDAPLTDLTPIARAATDQLSRRGRRGDRRAVPDRRLPVRPVRPARASGRGGGWLRAGVGLGSGPLEAV